jgi:hypothetical protein
MIAQTQPLFCFTVDTEPDDLWNAGAGVSFEHFSRLAEFHRRITRVGARPTYLTTSEVVEDAAALKALRDCQDIAHCEIGAHFHTWTRQWPFPVPDLGTPPVQALAHQLGADVEQRMLMYTCEAIEKAVGEPPRSYRGGRFSLSADSVAGLVGCGIQVDSTVTPGLNWRRPGSALEDGPDFTHVPRQPYFLESGEDITVAREQGALLELPVGAAWVPAVVHRLSGSRRLQHVLERLPHRTRLPWGLLWLRPTFLTSAQLAACLRQLKREGITVWVAMIHSSEIVPCRHLPTAEAVEAFIRRCEKLTAEALKLGARACTLREVPGQLEVAHHCGDCHRRVV